MQQKQHSKEPFDTRKEDLINEAYLSWPSLSESLHMIVPVLAHLEGDPDAGLIGGSNVSSLHRRRCFRFLRHLAHVCC